MGICVKEMQDLEQLMKMVREERRVFRVMTEQLPVPIVEEFEQVEAVAVAEGE